MGRGGQKKESGDRRCIVTGESQPRAGLIRFVLAPDGQVTADILEKLPGRGLWVTADRGTLEKAAAKNPFSRAAKTRAQVPSDLATQVDKALTQRLISLISLARRSGGAICGFEQVKAALLAEDAQVLLQASDGSENQKRKLRPPSGRHAYISCLTASELGLAFGRGYVIHAALAKGGLSETIGYDARRLAGLRGGNAKINAGTARTEGT